MSCIESADVLTTILDDHGSIFNPSVRVPIQLQVGNSGVYQHVRRILPSFHLAEQTHVSHIAVDGVRVLLWLYKGKQWVCG